MPSETFQASRWTRGNLLFPTAIEVSDKAVVRRKRSWFSRDEISISMQKIASIHTKTGLIWSDVLIESSGGTDPLASHGHRKGDARRIKDLIEDFQSRPAREDEPGQQPLNRLEGVPVPAAGRPSSPRLLAQGALGRGLQLVQFGLEFLPGGGRH